MRMCVNHAYGVLSATGGADFPLGKGTSCLAIIKY